MMRLEQVSVVLGGRPVLRDVSLALAPGELVAVVGPNGAGKSTLLGVASGERVPRRGRVTLDGEPLTSLAPERWARRHAVVAQRARLDAALRVHEVVALGRWPHRGHTSVIDDQRAIAQALDQVGARPLEARRYTELSGGEQQRVQLARALAQLDAPIGPGQSRVLLLDEPVASLDPALQHRVLTLARQRAAAGDSVMAVLHDLNHAAQYADRVVLLHRGRVMADGAPHHVLTRDHVAAAFEIEVLVMRHPCFDCPLIVHDVRSAALVAEPAFA